MANDRWERLKEIVQAALEREVSDRDTFLDGACLGDANLRKEIDSLLASHQEDGFLDTPPIREVGDSGVPLNEDTASVTRVREGKEELDDERQIGPYRILQELGHGGMGVVYDAEQEKPVHRRVALKLIKLGMDTKQVIARFESERQALALMNHPNIASVYDAGSTESGRPYFAMEYVQGIPITEYCDKHRLRIKERLELFIAVCEGVQHAHQKGIIHRDLKPSNVLVKIQDDKPVPKIIDFGVAKATAHRLTERTVYTELGQLIGTPEFMSPEQAEMTGLDIDTRTDVYSLGVILYELLVGAQPFDAAELRKAGFEGVRRIIREKDPLKPSTKLQSLSKVKTDSAKNRRVEQWVLEKELRGDLDWITMKALEKDRTRRYGSPSELAADIRRHLRNEPVVAGPPSQLYRMQKFIQRHRVGVAVATGFLALLVGFSVMMAIQSARIARERDRADQRRDQAEDLIGFMLGDLREKLVPIGRLEILDDVGDEALEYFAAVPPGSLTDEELFRRSQALRQIGQIRLYQGDSREAKQAVEESLSLAEAVVARNPEKAEWRAGLGASHSSVGTIVHLEGDLEGALNHHRSSLSIAESLVSEDPGNSTWQLQLASSCSSIANVEQEQGNLNESLSQYTEALKIINALVESEPSNLDWRSQLGGLENSVGRLLSRMGRLEEAEDRLRAALKIDEDLVQKKPTDTGSRFHLSLSHHFFADVLEQIGNLDEALAHFESAVNIARYLATHDPYNPIRRRGLAVGSIRVGRVLTDLGRLDEANSYFRDALDIMQSLVEKEPDEADWLTYLAVAHFDLGRLEFIRGHPDGALEEASKALPLFEEVHTKDPEYYVNKVWLSRAQILLGRIHYRGGQIQQARRSWEQARNIIEPLAQNSNDTGILVTWGTALLHLDRTDEAKPIVEKLREMGYKHPDFVQLCREKGMTPDKRTWLKLLHFPAAG